MVGIAVDYWRVEPRGFTFRPLTQDSPVDRSTAEARAVDHVTRGLGAETPTKVDSDRAGAFYLCFLGYESNDSGLVVIHARSGEVVFAGLEVWADPDRGYDPPLPAGWQGPAALGCTDAAAEPASKALRPTGIPMGTEPASTPSDALEVAVRLNLVQQFAADKPYRAMVVSYSTDTGEFDPWSADWLVWLTKDR